MRLVAAAITSLCVVFAAPPAMAVTSAERSAELSLLSKINNKRVATGRQSVIEHSFILELAEKHSAAMARRNKLGHYGFNDRVSALRANDAGINGYICENVAYARGYSSSSQAMRIIFRGWMQSSGHRACMLHGDTQSAAVGIKLRGSTWWATYIAAHDSTP